MDEFKVITIMNEAMIEVLKETNQNYERNIKIGESLKDEELFFKVNKSEDYEILKNVGVKEDKFEILYKKLTDANIFYDLLQKGKIREDDEDLVIRYEKYRK